MGAVAQARYCEGNKTVTETALLEAQSERRGCDRSTGIVRGLSQSAAWTAKQCGLIAWAEANAAGACVAHRPRTANFQKVASDSDSGYRVCFCSVKAARSYGYRVAKAPRSLSAR
mgnify:CR=1 FL=1